MSFSKEMSQSGEPLSLAGKIVQDADRLEAIGALGILRTAYYGGGGKGIQFMMNRLSRKYTLKRRSIAEEVRSLIIFMKNYYYCLRECIQTMHANWLLNEKILWSNF